MVNTKEFYNGEKVAIIPLFLVNNEIVSDFKAKANLSNIFSSRCTPLTLGHYQDGTASLPQC